jgi:hypothetical protein
MRGWCENPFKEKPAIVHYQDALNREKSIERESAQQDSAQRAIKIGLNKCEAIRTQHLRPT